MKCETTLTKGGEDLRRNCSYLRIMGQRSEHAAKPSLHRVSRPGKVQKKKNSLCRTQSHISNYFVKPSFKSCPTIIPNPQLTQPHPTPHPTRSYKQLRLGTDQLSFRTSAKTNFVCTTPVEKDPNAD